MIMPGLVFTGLALYPFIEAWVTGDKREHNLLDRPRNAPTRTAFGVMAITFYALLWVGGANDIIATAFDLSINSIIWFLRVSIFILPPIAFVVTKRICLGLQRRDRDKLLHGYESGRVLRLPHGEFIEVHQPLSAKDLAVITAKTDVAPLPAPEKADADGVRNKHYRIGTLRHRLSTAFFGDNVAPRTQRSRRVSTTRARCRTRGAAPRVRGRGPDQPRTRRCPSSSGHGGDERRADGRALAALSQPGISEGARIQYGSGPLPHVGHGDVTLRE
jgi:hypothetical protein